MTADPRATQYGQHISIALQKFNEYVVAAATFERQVKVGGMFRPVTREDIVDDAEMLDGARHAQHRVQELWGEIWSQLDDARQIAQQLGRDTSAYDDSRTISREYGSGATLDVGAWNHSSGAVYTRSVTHEVGPATLIHHAMGVLLAAVPEAELPTPMRDDEVPDLGSSKLGVRVIAAIGIAIVIAIVVAWIQIKR